MATAVIELTPLKLGLAAVGGLASFTTVRDVTEPWFGDRAWTVPIGVDAGILILLAWDLLLEYLGMAWPMLRLTAWSFIVATVFLNISADGFQPVPAIMHAAMPMLCIAATKGIRHMIRGWIGLADGTPLERIPASRWLLAPASTLVLWRRLVLWHARSYHDGLHLQHHYLLHVARLQQHYGRWAWRWKAPLTDRLALRLRPAEHALGASDDIRPPPTKRRLTLVHDETTDGRDEAELLRCARQIHEAARQEGVQLTQARRPRRFANAASPPPTDDSTDSPGTLASLLARRRRIQYSRLEGAPEHDHRDPARRPLPPPGPDLPQMGRTKRRRPG